jgi:hypothetical protein
MIANDYQLESAKAELSKWRNSLADLEAILPTLPHSIATQVKANRSETIHQRIQELKAEIQQYARAQRNATMSAP